MTPDKAKVIGRWTLIMAEDPVPRETDLSNNMCYIANMCVMLTKLVPPPRVQDTVDH